MPSILLVGPYDPSCGEYTFLAPPLGVWRLKGVLAARGYDAAVFDPNCAENADVAFSEVLRSNSWDVIGFSTTGMTLKWDLSLAHSARRLQPAAFLVAGGMEATFNTRRMFELGPYDLAVLGEGERPLLAIMQKIEYDASLEGIPGTAWIDGSGQLQTIQQPALSRTELRDAILLTPYDEMPYESYWERLEEAYGVGSMPTKAEREARLAEIRSVRLITLNYCPMGCTFCSSTNFLDAAQGGTARVARLDVDECLTMIRRIVEAHPEVRTIIFQDDIFVFRADPRILPLMAAIIEAKDRGELPAALQFISTNRIDAMNPERLLAMRDAGFRVLGFGIENFSVPVLEEFNKRKIYEHIEPVLTEARALGIVPFLDVILTSPRCSMRDVAETIRQSFHWIEAGCEVGLYPYVIPFSGAAMSDDPSLRSQTTYARVHVPGTAVQWEQATKILPFDDTVRDAIISIEESFTVAAKMLEPEVAHLPSRVRSLLWIACAIPVLSALGEAMPPQDVATAALFRSLPGVTAETCASLRAEFGGAELAVASN